MNQNLYDDLVVLREKLKEKAAKTKKVFNCSDGILEQIATLCPKKISDFESISGVGTAFIENYAQYFIQVVKADTETDDSIKLNKKGISILQNYEKKLINLNKRNHLLYCPKLYNNFGVDLSNATNDIRNIILSSGRTATVAKAEDQNYKTIISLLRSNNRNLREKGQNNLFIAYPFVKGKFADEDFTIRAPLALFPIKGERSTTGVKLTLDREREVLYNTTLILANFKFKKMNKEIPEATVEDTSKETFIKSLLEFYKNNKLFISPLHPDEDSDSIIPFENYTADTFPEFSKGEFVLEKSAVLGIFPITSSSIQKDFQQIVENKKINVLLDDLLGNKDYEAFDWNKPQDISEKEISYINNLDAAQENVIAALGKTDELVVQGPPGTGKSQTITSLISDYAIKEKSVLLVSEKKTALDVVYSRLGNLSKYALLLDDVNDKVSFYSQLEAMINLEQTPAIQEEKLESLESKIDEHFDSFKNIEKTLFTPDEFGIEPYKLYLVSDVQEILKKENLRKNRKFSELLGECYKNFTYADVINSKNFYKRNDNLSKTEKFLKFQRDYFWLQHTKSNLTDFDLQNAMIDIEEILGDSDSRAAQKFLKKLFSKNLPKKELVEFINRYFEFKENQKSTSKKVRKYLYKNPQLLSQSFDFYEDYWKLNHFYDQIEDPTKDYYLAAEKLLKECDKISVAIDELASFICAKHLIDLEAANRDVFGTLSDSENILESIDTLIGKKRMIDKKKMEQILSNQIVMLSQSKRRSEILKAVEAKRKWTVNRFINKFNFELFHSIKIWLLTPEVVSEIIPMEPGFFDLVVFDEASQMFVEKGIPSILRGKKVVIAGDQKQLRPSNLFNGRFQLDEDQVQTEASNNNSENSDENSFDEMALSIASDEDSLLDLARFKYNKVMLNFHYRSAYEELIAFSNFAFYDGKLYVSPNTIKPTMPPIEVHKMENAVWTNRANQDEAECTVQLIKRIFKERKHNETIGVITFNTNQRDAIDDLLDKECEKDPDFASIYSTEILRKKDGEDIGLFVKNIETVQGDERDIIIFSMGYAKNKDGKFIQNFGWLNQIGGENRLNVAVSRAKKKIHIVVSFDPSDLKTDGLKNKGPAILKNYLNYAFAVNEGNKDKQKRILDELVLNNRLAQKEETAAISKEMVLVDENFELNKTPEKTVEEGQYRFQLEMEKFLSDHGYSFDRNVGIGGYVIDYAIIDNNEYILGIECDSHLYSNPSTVRERDYYRQKYLESRGWKIYRMWSILWKKNPEKAGKALLEEIERNLKD